MFRLSFDSGGGDKQLLSTFCLLPVQGDKKLAVRLVGGMGTCSLHVFSPCLIERFGTK